MKDDIGEKAVGCKDFESLVDEELKKFDALCDKIEGNVARQSEFVAKFDLMNQEIDTFAQKQWSQSGFKETEDLLNQILPIHNQLIQQSK